jgi:hypothetical protein
LSEQLFDRFITLTFDQGKGPFRLWGNPIKRSGPRVHVYGLDLHLWQKIYLDMTPTRFVVILPNGTCGNTVHRLATNIQRYLDPLVQVRLGSTLYEDLISAVWRSQPLTEHQHSTAGDGDAR